MEKWFFGTQSDNLWTDLRRRINLLCSRRLFGSLLRAAPPRCCSATAPRPRPPTLAGAFSCLLQSPYRVAHSTRCAYRYHNARSYNATHVAAPGQLAAYAGFLSDYEASCSHELGMEPHALVDVGSRLLTATTPSSQGTLAPVSIPSVRVFFVSAVAAGDPQHGPAPNCRLSGGGRGHHHRSRRAYRSSAAVRPRGCAVLRRSSCAERICTTGSGA